MIKTAVCGILVLCLISIIQNNNMKSCASKITKGGDLLFFAWCCRTHCRKGDECIRIERTKTRGCRCFRYDRKVRGGGKWKTYLTPSVKKTQSFTLALNALTLRMTFKHTFSCRKNVSCLRKEMFPFFSCCFKVIYPILAYLGLKN